MSSPAVAAVCAFVMDVKSEFSGVVPHFCCFFVIQYLKDIKVLFLFHFFYLLMEENALHFNCVKIAVCVCVQLKWLCSRSYITMETFS